MCDPENNRLVDIKTASLRFLKSYNPKNIIPVPIEEIAESSLGLRIILISGLIKDYGVNAFITNTFDRIVVDETMYSKQPQRIRFTIAEEIGHLILHKDWYLKNGPPSDKSYLDWQENLDVKRYEYIERQAKTFASMVLIPESELDIRWNKYCSIYKISSPCSFFDLSDTFPEFATEFDVTPESMLVRLNFTKKVTLPDNFWEKKNSLHKSNK